MKIKKNIYQKYPVFYRKLDKKIIKTVNAVIKSNWISSNGPYNNKLEADLVRNFNVTFCSTISSGTSALESALFSLNLKRGDEVIVPSFTIVSCINVILRLGLKPHIIDVDKDTWCLNLSILKKHVTRKTKALIYVHIFGNSDQIDLVSKYCKSNKIFLIEDCAESMFTKYKNQYTGTFGDVSTFSLYSNKLISSGEGGFVLTNNKKFYKRIESYKNLFFGKKDRFNHKDMGFNYRMTNIQSAIAWQELQIKEKYININNYIGKKYFKYLDMNKFTIQKISKDCDHIFWMVPILFNKKVNIKKIQAHLLNIGIDTRRLFKPLSKMSYLKNFNVKISLTPNSNFIYDRGIYIPSGHNLKNKDIKHISEQLNKLDL